MISKFANAIILFILVFALTTLLSTNSSAQTGAISLDHTVGRLGLSDSLACGQPIEFFLRTTNNTGVVIDGYAIAHQVYSPDNAMWSPIVLDTIPPGWKGLLDLIFGFGEFSVSGSGSDTVCWTAWTLFSPGLLDGFDSVTHTISTQLNCSEEGKTICLDSVTDGLGGCDWLWGSTAGLVVPLWSGPHCFTIINCCSGIRGDLNYDGSSANILDLSFMVDFIFRGSNDPGDCIVSRDINGDGKGPNILDLSFLVDFIFRGGPPPEACP